MKNLLSSAGLLKGVEESRELNDDRFKFAGVGIAAGVIAGFVANGFIAAAIHFSHRGEYAQGLWDAALAVMLGSSAFARVKTHFALDPAVPYDKWFLTFDVLVVSAASAALGLVERASFPDEAFWVAALLVALFLVFRNVRLASHTNYFVPLGQWLIVVGIVVGILVLLQTPSSKAVATIVAGLALVGALVQLFCETLNRREIGAV